MAELKPGDILVCAFTTRAYNVVFPLVAGVVTEHGGPLGHTAVMAREFGFPAIVGAGPVDVTTGDVLTITAAEATPASAGG